ncbi:MAG: MBL fold metallo-hydrolase [Alphaproteobacteria bacterium]|nr:MBL fold metallo-hydrolase [Alphaproteobacteria bacterium]
MSPASDAAEVKATFYGNAHFRFVSTQGTVILLNPWIKGNADATVKVGDFKKGDVDVILATSGHGDDMGQTAEIAARTGATVIAAAELGGYIAQRIKALGGNPRQVWGAAISGRRKIGNVTIQVLQADHGTGYAMKGAKVRQYGGPALGFLMTFENGLKVLMAGSTGLSMELQLFGMRYKPHVVMVPIMGRYMMHPDDAAYAVKLLKTDNPNLKTAIPQHFRLKKRFPWMGTPAQFAFEVKKLGLNVNVLIPKVGQEFSLTK